MSSKDENAAIKIATECIHKAMKRIAVDANLAKLGGEAAPPNCKKALAQYEKYAEAVKILARIKSQKSLF